jgi:hypothetical protein
MPLPAAIAAEKDMSALFERWMQTCGVPGGTQADKAMLSTWQQSGQLQESDRRAKRDAAAVQRKRMHFYLSAALDVVRPLYLRHSQSPSKKLA